MKKSILSKRFLNKFFLGLAIFAIIGSFFSVKMAVVCNIITLLCLLSLFFINFWFNLLVCKLMKTCTIREKCPYFKKEDCPYGDISECKYDTSNCYAFSEVKHISKYTITVIILLVVSLIATICCEFAEEIAAFFYINNSHVLTASLKIIQPIANSIIAAIFMSWLIDIPGRMREYKKYFIDLLTSEDYLKFMSESQLTRLRSRVTWFMHVKDYPKMPEGLIAIDEKICRMLKKPYYANYSQSMVISEKEDTFMYHDEKQDECKSKEKKKVFAKEVSVVYTAMNPYGKNKAIKMNIGVGNNLLFPDNVSNELIRNMFQIKKFSIIIGEDKHECDLIPYIGLGYTREKIEGLKYNGKVIVMSKKFEGNEDNPLTIEQLLVEKDHTDNNSEDYEIPCKDIKDRKKNGLFISFTGKIHIQLKYTVIVPQNDHTFTKRLNYPARNFHLDYCLDESIKNLSVEGQIIGTIIDQEDVITELTNNDKRICLRTQNWLLEKNGAVIVHCSN